ncbi:MAG: NAD(P)H-binding protein, partial [Pseudomonadota bacterium]
MGGRLISALLLRGYHVRAMVRSSKEVYVSKWENVEVVESDALKVETLNEALRGIHTIYYLIHSMLLGPDEFMAADIIAAYHFRTVAEEMGVQRIIYLGGLGDITKDLSHHLRSRMEVSKALQAGKYKTTVLRASIIIGSGSASYEIIKDLACELPILFMPRWRKTLCQPIAVRDVIKYLIGVLEKPEMTTGTENTFDIGGPEIFTYEEMIYTMAKLLKKKVYIFPVP